jgi:hypothetical protein
VPDADARRDARDILLVGGAVGVVVVAYLAFLRHRTDYPGHLLAGYGATLGALGGAVLLRPRSATANVLGHDVLVLVGTLGCVGGGLLLEATAFRFARFDWVDAFGQSLGAALAGLSVLAVSGPARPSPAVAAFGLLLAVAATAAGFFLAFH